MNREAGKVIVTDEMRQAVFEDLLRYRLLPHPVIEYLNDYLEAMGEDSPEPPTIHPTSSQAGLQSFRGRS